MDSRVYQVEYEDGHSEAYIFNTILDNLHSQIDEDGHRYWIFSRLVDHRRDPKASKGKPRAGNSKSNGRMARRLGRHCLLLRRATWLK